MALVVLAAHATFAAAALATASLHPAAAPCAVVALWAWRGAVHQGRRCLALLSTASE